MQKGTLNVDVVMKPPQIKVDDRKTKTFHCRQQVPDSHTEKVRFLIHRLKGEKTQLFSHGDFESVSLQKMDEESEDGKKFVIQTFSDRLPTYDEEERDEGQ